MDTHVWTLHVAAHDGGGCKPVRVQETLFPLTARYNIAPSQQVAVVTQEAGYGVRFLEGYQWGLVPYWARSRRSGSA